MTSTLLGGADLTNSNLSGAKLKNAKLRGANLKGAIFNHEGQVVDLEGADLTNTIMPDGSLH